MSVLRLKSLPANNVQYQSKVWTQVCPKFGLVLYI